MSAQNAVLIHLVDVVMFHWITERCDLLVRGNGGKYGGPAKIVNRIYLLGIRDICPKICGNPSDSCWHILEKGDGQTNRLLCAITAIN